MAFSWNGPSQDNFDIYVQVVGGAGPPLRLTSDVADDISPAWSPDGRNIAFYRTGANGRTVFLISPLGGPERPLTRAGHASLAWTPDGSQLGIVDLETSGSSGPLKLFLVSIATGERRQLTAPPDDVDGDIDMAFSPDAHTVAFVRRGRTLASDVYVAPVQSPPGEPRRITFDQAALYGFSWLPDSASLLISSSRAGPPELWRVDVEPSRIRGPQRGLERVSAPQAFARFPSVSARARSAEWQVAYEVRRQDYNIWRLQVDPVLRFQSERLIASTRSDEDPQYSPDGSKIVFSSDRSGNPEIWISEADGSSPRQLTFLRSGSVGAPRWSPDGSLIAFDALVGGNRDIYTMDARNGVLSRLTYGSSNEARPSWSADGQWLYFRSDRSGRQEIWKLRVSPKREPEAVQVTRAGGFEAFESPDGKTVNYVKEMNRLGLWSIPAGAGTETLVHPWVRDGAWAVAERGIYFLRQLCRDADAASYRSIAISDRIPGFRAQ